MHKLLPGVVEGGRNQYAQTTQEAMEVGNRIAVCFTRYNQAKAIVFEASQRFECARVVTKKNLAACFFQQVTFSIKDVGPRRRQVSWRELLN
jgi:hypothetical protein